MLICNRNASWQDGDEMPLTTEREKRDLYNKSLSDRYGEITKTTDHYDVH